MTSTFRKRKKKTKRKLRNLTSIMPMLEWRPDHMHMFRMPFKVGGMKNLQVHTPIKSRKKKVWANVYQKLSHLPYEIYMKDIEFGFIPKDHYGGWNTDEHNIVWTNQQVELPINDIKGLAFRGMAITHTAWAKTYNPYTKYKKFIINILRHNARLQMSLPSLMQTYKENGTWEEIKSIKKDIWDIVTSDTLSDMWFYFTPQFKEFIVPNPIPSARITFHEISPLFNFLLNKGIMERHKLSKHILKSAPKPSSQWAEEPNPYSLTPEQQRTYNNLSEQPTRSDGTTEEEDNPF